MLDLPSAQPDQSTLCSPASRARTVAGCLFLTAMLAACSHSSSKPPVDDASSELPVRLQKILDDSHQAGMPGIALSIRGPALDFDGIAGVQDADTQTPLHNDNRFYLASVGKTYTAVALTRLASDEILSLDDPVSRWLHADLVNRIPEAESITVRQLLNHTSGLLDFQNDGEAWDQAFLSQPDRSWRNVDALEFIVDRPLHASPATGYRYSNSNYVLAALIAEAATGSPISSIVRNTIIEPYGLQSTIQGEEASGIAGFVHGYVTLDNETLDVYPWYQDYGISDGGMQTSAADLADFIHQTLSGNGALDEQGLDVLLTPSRLGTPASDYALGISVSSSEQGDTIIYSHSGKDPGAQADYLHIVNGDTRVTIAICASASFGQYDQLYQQALADVISILGAAE